MRKRVCVVLKKKIRLIIVNALLLIAFFVTLAVSVSIRGTLRSQQVAAMWAGQSGQRFSQLSVFFHEGTIFQESEIARIHQSIDNALLDAAVERDQRTNNYTDAWSAAGEVIVTGERGSTSAKVLGVGGDFFQFHPLYLRDGSYISGRDLMKDRVVLDEELAWRLFGSVHIAGLGVSIEGKPYLIAGVVARESDFASSRAYEDGAGMFMSFEALGELTNEQARIMAYELVMPEPISGFAFRTISGLFYEADIVENSTRYSLTSILAIIRSPGQRSMRTDNAVYPYWENAARYTEDLLALLYVLTFVLFLFPAFCAVVYSVKAMRCLVKSAVRIVLKKLQQRDEKKALIYRHRKDMH